MALLLIDPQSAVCHCVSSGHNTNRSLSDQSECAQCQPVEAATADKLLLAVRIDTEEDGGGELHGRFELDYNFLEKWIEWTREKIARMERVRKKQRYLPNARSVLQPIATKDKIYWLASQAIIESNRIKTICQLQYS